jgi:hypothetical protein
MAIGVDEIIVQCGDCGWQGAQRLLSQWNGHAYCPKCGREFYKFPPCSSHNTGVEVTPT